jgi:hypothetical protein
MRTRTHEVDTQACKIVPLTFPREWEPREVTGRDYGIDLELELFEDRKSTGYLLLIQIKGTEKELVFKNNLTCFDVPTKTLMYAEKFVNPFLLTLCPINIEKPIAYYLWLQDYINSVLNFENPYWRNNTSTTRVFIPERNVMPGNNEHLSHIAHFPQRLYGICEVSRILHNLRYKLDGESQPSDYEEVVTGLEQILTMPGFLKGHWKRGEFIEKNYICPGIIAANHISTRKIPDSSAIAEMPLLRSFKETEVPEGFKIEEYVDFLLKGQVSHGLNCIEFFYEETNYSFKNFQWKEFQGHDF